MEEFWRFARQVTERNVLDQGYSDFSKTLGKVFAVLLDEMAKPGYKQKDNTWVIFLKINLENFMHMKKYKTAE